MFGRLTVLTETTSGHGENQRVFSGHEGRDEKRQEWRYAVVRGDYMAGDCDVNGRHHRPRNPLGIYWPRRLLLRMARYTPEERAARRTEREERRLERDRSEAKLIVQWITAGANFAECGARLAELVPWPRPPFGSAHVKDVLRRAGYMVTIKMVIEAPPD